MFLQGARRLILRQPFLRRQSNSNPPRTWKVLFFGSDDVSLPSLQRLQSSQDLVTRLEVVVTEKPQPNIKEGAEVARWCLEKKIPLHEWKDVDSAVQGFDIGVVASFGKFIPPKIINSFPHKMINMHPSLLPRYRGAAPIMHAIRQGDTETGVCIIDLHPTSWDKGHIYSRTEVPISFEDTILTLTPRLAQVGADQVINTLRNYDLQNSQKQPQPEILPEESHKARAPKLQTADFCIQWGSGDHMQVYNNWRANPTKSYTFFEKSQLKVSQLTVPKEIPRSVKEVEFEFMKRRGDPNLPAEGKLLPDEGLGSVADSEAAGSIVFHKPLKMLFVRCLRGWVAITELFVPTSHKPLTPPEFMNNYQVKKIVNPKFSSEIK